jgi:hypothetical protein
MEVSSPERHVDEWICRQNEDQQLRCPCDMMIDEAPPCRLVHLRIFFAIEFLEQEAFENIKPYQKVVDEDNTNDQSAKRGQARNRLQRYLGNMRPFRDGRVVDGSRQEGVLHDRIEAPWEHEVKSRIGRCGRCEGAASIQQARYRRWHENSKGKPRILYRRCSESPLSHA